MHVVQGAIIAVYKPAGVLGILKGKTMKQKRQRRKRHRQVPSSCRTAEENEAASSSSSNSPPTAVPSDDKRSQITMNVRPQPPSSRRENVSVGDIISSELCSSELGTVGRLDKLTTGLMLLMKDGGISALLLDPQHHVTKTYTVNLIHNRYVMSYFITFPFFAVFLFFPRFSQYACFHLSGQSRREVAMAWLTMPYSSSVVDSRYLMDQCANRLC